MTVVIGFKDRGFKSVVKVCLMACEFDFSFHLEEEYHISYSFFGFLCQHLAWISCFGNYNVIIGRNDG